MQESSFAACLTALQQSGVNFILVGALAAVLQGAPLQTYDVAIVYFRTNENVERLLDLLNSIDAIFRIQPARRIRPKTRAILPELCKWLAGTITNHEKKVCVCNCRGLKRLPKM